MGRKIFVSYKYSDNQVLDLGLSKPSVWGGMQIIQTTARHYVDKLSEILENDDHIYKGENDNESLAEFADEHIETKLKDKIFDSTITIVLISKGMKNSFLSERDQWMPWEISYSLKEITRNGRTSSSNAILAVILPDEFGKYDYYITHNSECNCRSLNTTFLFNILSCNMFNQRVPLTEKCINGSTIYYGDSSYIQSVKWEDFIYSHNYYINNAIEIRNKQYNYNVTRNIK